MGTDVFGSSFGSEGRSSPTLLRRDQESDPNTDSSDSSLFLESKEIPPFLGGLGPQ